MKRAGKIITRLRRENNMGQKELAEHLKLSIGTISNYENGIHSPDPDTLCQMAEYFHVTIDYLLGRTCYRCPPEILNDYIGAEDTASEFANMLLSLDAGSQTAVVQFTSYLKFRQNP